MEFQRSVCERLVAGEKVSRVLEELSKLEQRYDAADALDGYLRK
jgi:hypothetical protein